VVSGARTVHLIATTDHSPGIDDTVRERLLTAWRGEILAGSVYELIALRLDQREADILRRMAQAESGHRGRIEARMTELGIPVPDSSTVKVPRWLRLQARIAPVDRLLAAREAAENDEVDDLYKRSTGDNTTDRLLRDIRREERSHSLAVADLRAGGRDETIGGGGFGGGQPGDPLSAHPPDRSSHPPDRSTHPPDPSSHPPDRSAHPPDRSSHPPDPSAHPPDPSSHPPDRSAPPRPSPPVRGDGGPLAIPGARQRLDKILGREKWHRSGTSWISGAIYGANDGLAAVFGIVAGVSGATGGASTVLTAGLAGAIASALSMATGAFLAERSENEVAAANVDRERQEITEHPEEEREELSLFYQLKGVDPATAAQMAEQMSRNPDAMLQALSAEEFGVTAGGGGDPVQASIAAGISTGIGAIIPVIPFMITTGTVAIIAAAIVSLLAHFLVGAAKSLVTLRSWWSAGLEMMAAGVIVGGTLYLIGLVLPT
jgi:VIT1/CCC1 family predicted Fe2+/Mn2+ transporter